MSVRVSLPTGGQREAPRRAWAGCACGGSILQAQPPRESSGLQPSAGDQCEATGGRVLGEAARGADLHLKMTSQAAGWMEH